MNAMHKPLAILATLLTLSFNALAVAPPANDCDARAAEKKLAGAAKNSFLKKCNADAAAAAPKADPAEACESKAKDKKLAGAAKNSFMKKCVADNSGS